MTATRTTIDAAVYAAIEPGLVTTFAQSTPLLNLLGAKPLESGDTINWKVKYSGTSAGGDFDEGDAIPSAGRSLYANCQRSLQAVGVPVTITGHALDALRGNRNYFDALKEEMNDGMRQLAMLVEADVLAWLLESVDDDTTYAGQTRATVHMDSVVVDADSGTLSVAQMRYATAQLRYRPREVVLSPSEHMILSAPDICDEYKENLVAGYDATRPLVRNASDPNLDAAMFQKTAHFANVPWYEVNSMASTYWLLVKKSDIMLRYNRGFTIEPLGKDSDDTKWWMTWHGGLGYRDPYRAAKIENIVL